MESEQLAIFTEQMERIGVCSRTEVHAQGYWHETFHCWFLQQTDGKDYLLFQLRAAQKKDFPSTLDVTAAGHLLADETPADGVREIEEELGVKLSFHDLIDAGIIPHQIELGALKNREFCHIYFYQLTQAIETLVLQPEEVAGIFQIELGVFEQFIAQERTTIPGYGYIIQADGTRQTLIKEFGTADLCPHNPHYFPEIIQTARQILHKSNA
ncbi:NUDIX hydrolase [Dictyobacter arantiisoli]|uniref:Putative Nudix hydrolase n=1 Tax=Dictyobacter arantiisoli TaxID=2014874 RepID=A0A5A5T682_9CHLR|nr:NUDIX domain-containing protein [Dictyobacter arantiisoli]GCF06961.1 putative Nudix hydrolase [Dictyobacter arantiisoli]